MGSRHNCREGRVRFETCLNEKLVEFVLDLAKKARKRPNEIIEEALMLYRDALIITKRLVIPSGNYN